MGSCIFSETDITRKSTWIFKIRLRFWKYRSSLSSRWNLYRYGPLVMKLEPFEVGYQLEEKNVTPYLNFKLTDLTHGGSPELESGRIDFKPRNELKFCRNWGCMGFLSTISSENASEKSYRPFSFFSKKKVREYAWPLLLIKLQTPQTVQVSPLFRRVLRALFIS